MSEEARRMLRELLAEALAGNGNGHGQGPPAQPQVPAPPVAAVLRPSTWSQPPAPGEVIGDGAPPAFGAPGPARVTGDGESPRAGTGGGVSRGAEAARAAGRGESPRAEAARAAGRGESPRAGAAPGARGGESPRSGAARAAGGAASPAAGARVERVALRSDADLAQFAAHVLAHAADVRSGALRFTFAEAAARVRRVERGAVTERTVNEAAQAGQRLVLAPAAVLTPLAKERARHLKVEIERERRC